MESATVPVQASGSRFDPFRLLRSYSFAFALILALAMLIADLLVQPDFGWKQQLAAFAPFALAAMASTPSIISGRGGFDVSISPLIVFINILFVVWLAPAGLGGAVAVPILLCIGAAVGAINGALIVFLRLQPVIVTLCTYFIVIGVNNKIAATPTGVHDTWITYLSGSVFGIPGGLITVAVPLILWALIKRSPYGRALFAVGSSDATAYASGVNVGAVRICAYALGGLIAAVGGLALTGLVSSADAGTSTSYTLAAIAAVAVGGTSLQGGRGGLFGPVLGAAVIYLLQDILTASQVSQTWVQITYGVILLASVVLGARLSSVGRDEA